MEDIRQCISHGRGPPSPQLRIIEDVDRRLRDRMESFKKLRGRSPHRSAPLLFCVSSASHGMVVGHGWVWNADLAGLVSL